MTNDQMAYDQRGWSIGHLVMCIGRLVIGHSNQLDETQINLEEKYKKRASKENRL